MLCLKALGLLGLKISTCRLRLRLAFALLLLLAACCMGCDTYSPIACVLDGGLSPPWLTYLLN